jgi:hypothetical protein
MRRVWKSGATGEKDPASTAGSSCLPRVELPSANPGRLSRSLPSHANSLRERSRLSGTIFDDRFLPQAIQLAASDIFLKLSIPFLAYPFVDPFSELQEVFGGKLFNFRFDFFNRDHAKQLTNQTCCCKFTVLWLWNRVLHPDSSHRNSWPDGWSTVCQCARSWSRHETA